jgi:hypothetical protein
MSSKNLSLAQHLAGGQLPMFMSAKEIMTHYEPHEEEYHSGEDTSQLWDRKLRESKETPYKGSTRFKTFKEEGVKHPIEIGFPAYLDRGEGAIYEGHHRVASMNKIDSNRMLPVSYLDSKDY